MEVYCPGTELTPFRKLLTCIVHAKRPLRLEELCEATALLGLSDGQDLIKSQVLLRKQVEALCEPLAQVKVVEGVQGSFLVCTLTHATVRNYLIKNPEVLSSNTPNACPITSAAMANVCLSYLSQPRYQRLLVCKGDTFVNPAGEDVMEHHLLSYAAKYWDRHLDDVSYTVKWCERVKQFLASPQFQTCLQVQSLLVGGAVLLFYIVFVGLS
jgi:hypothetical protein